MSWVSRLLRVVTPGRVDRDLEAEMRLHLEERTKESARAGMPVRGGQGASVPGVRATRCSSANRATTLKVLPRIESDPARDTRVRPPTSGVATSSRPLPRWSLCRWRYGACTAAFSLIDALILRTLPRSTNPTVADSPRRARASRDSRRAQLQLPPLPRAAACRPIGTVRLVAVSDQRRLDVTFDDRGQPRSLYAQWISGDTFGLFLIVNAAAGRRCWQLPMTRAPGQLRSPC